MRKTPDKDILAKIDEVFVVDLVAGKIYGRKFKKEIGTYGSKGNRLYSCPYIYVGVLVERGHPVYRNRMAKTCRKIRRSHVVWYKATGKWPVKIEYIDGNRENDAFQNLRECAWSHAKAHYRRGEGDPVFAGRRATSSGHSA